MMRLLFLFGFFVVLYSCTDNRAGEESEMAKLPPQYYYYPRANVYFDSANKEYLFSGSDTANWQTAKLIPAVVQSLMDKSVFIQTPANPVWKDNENHKLVYSASLYATANDTVARKAPPKPVAKSRSIDSSGVVKKERKGIRKFFDKIFGKSKKGKENKEKEATQQR